MFYTLICVWNHFKFAKKFTEREIVWSCKKKCANRAYAYTMSGMMSHIFINTLYIYIRTCPAINFPIIPPRLELFFEEREAKGINLNWRGEGGINCETHSSDCTVSNVSNPIWNPFFQIWCNANSGAEDDSWRGQKGKNEL